MDKGLGNNFGTVAANCENLKSDAVQGFTWVIAPNVDLMSFIPEEQHGQFVRELTEQTLEQFCDARDIDLPYAFAIHHRETTDKTAPGRANPHAHIILPGTYYSWGDGAYLPFYMNRNKRENHVELLHDIAENQMVNLLERYIGPDWETRYDQHYQAQLNAMTQVLTQTPEQDWDTP